MATQVTALQAAVNQISVKIGRPGASASGEFGRDADRAAARGLLELKHLLRVPKADPEHPFMPTEDDLTQAELACKAMRHLLKLPSLEALGAIERKALTAFQIGASGWLCPPEWSQQILSCLEAKTDLTGLATNLTISGSSLKLFADSAEFDEAQWACDSDCFGAQRVKDITVRQLAANLYSGHAQSRPNADRRF
jgi:hypothetical protein